MQRRLAAILAADVAGYSRMMAADETATLAAMQRHIAEVWTPGIERHRGRIVKLMGDGILAEFASIVEAVDCAVNVQQEMAKRNAGVDDGKRVAFRVGVHLGDVIVEGDDLYGDGVNVASRLEGIAEVGGVSISAATHEQIEGKLNLRFRPLGPQTLKNIPRPVTAFAVMLGTAAAWTESPAIQYCRTADGVRLAYATIGRGPKVVRGGSWLTHLEFNLRNPSILGMGALTNLAQDHEILLYDARGNGMSDWEVEEISLDAWVRDLEVVVDSAGYDRFALSAGSQAAPVGISYAARHPDRLTHLILYGGYALGWRKRSSAHIEQNEALMGLMRVGWGAESPAYRQLFTSLFMPDASKERWDLFNEAQRISASSEAALRVFEAQGQIDVRNLLPEVRTPTLVMHSRGDLRVPFEYGRQVAAGIPGARFVALPGNNHILQPGEPAAVRYLEEVRLFLGG